MLAADQGLVFEGTLEVPSRLRSSLSTMSYVCVVRLLGPGDTAAVLLLSVFQVRGVSQ